MMREKIRRLRRDWRARPSEQRSGVLLMLCGSVLLVLSLIGEWRGVLDTVQLLIGAYQFLLGVCMASERADRLVRRIFRPLGRPWSVVAPYVTALAAMAFVIGCVLLINGNISLAAIAGPTDPTTDRRLDLFWGWFMLLLAVLLAGLGIKERYQTHGIRLWRKPKNPA